MKRNNLCLVILSGGIFFFSLSFSGCKSNPPPEAEAPAEPVSAELPRDDVWALFDRGETGRVRELFLGKVDVHARDGRGRTPLHAAAENGDAELAAFFIALGAEVDALDDEKRSPLGISAARSGAAVAKALCAAGADIHLPLGGDSAALLGVKQGGEFLRALLTPASVESVDAEGRTILHLAAAAGDPRAVEIILAAGNTGAKKDGAGKTALDLALAEPDSRNHLEAAELLILAGGYSESPVYPYLAPAVRSSNYNIRSADGASPLHFAAREGFPNFIAFLLDRGTDVNIKNASGATALHEAARSGRLAAMETLLSRGAEVNVQDAKGNSALHIGIPPDVHQEAAALLLSHGINPNLRDVHGESPLHIVVTLNRSPDLLQTLLGGGADVSIRNIDGKTALYMAVEENKPSYIPLLLAYGSDIFAADNRGATVYERALLDRSALLTALITGETVFQNDSGGNTLLHLTVKNRGDDKIVGLILDQKALVNARNKEGDTSLHIAARLNEADSGSLLLSRGADIFAPNAKGESPLYLAFTSPGGVRKWMITPLTLEARDGLGNSVLHYVCQWGLDDQIPFVVGQGADTEAANATGETPLFTAVKYDNASTIRALLANGASLNSRDTLGNSALHAAVRWDAPRAAETLLEAGIDINAHSLNGNTPLHDAVSLGIVAMETLLVRYGANLEVRDAEGNTPFMEAVTAGYPLAMERLAELGADPTTRNSRGDTPLHIAVAMERSDLVTPLLSWGAPIHAKNSFGKSPFQIALATSPRMVSTLLTKDRIYSSDDSGFSPLHIAVREAAAPAMVKIIVDQGGRINSVDYEGRSPLRLAVDTKHWDKAKVMADAGADPFLAAGDGKTPAELALSSGEEGIRALFSGKGIAARDPSGNTILHYAAKSCKSELVTLLLELGANKGVKNIAAESPADIARRWNQNETAALLN
ncbi:MAG: ankyrin repeat domain-containing protein [Treponema sp.]|jgi:ankyrin repeat protein|nr:ankyrin repeat domain-containing protein [Treponema sp.]